MKKLENKVAVITGGNSGIGLATAVLFARHGAKAAITGRNRTTLDRAVEIVGNNAMGFVCDVSEVTNMIKV